MDDHNIDLNVGGKPQERFMLLRHEELPEFTEEEADAIKNLVSNRKDKLTDKSGMVLLLGTGGDTLGLHEAKTIFMDDRKDPSDYIVSYDPIKEGGFVSVHTQLQMGIAVVEPGHFRKIEGPGTVLWNKRVKAKNRLKKRYK